MDSFLKMFKKVGGFSLIKDYAKSHVLGTAAAQFLVLGTSRKALEILRLSVEIKIQNRLNKKYRKKLKQYPELKVKNMEHKDNKTVWICWLQGMENAPLVVQHCYNSVCEHLTDWSIVVITSDNFGKYTDFPGYIIEKWCNGVITDTHFSDLLRIELLTCYGGLWLDATVFCTGVVPDYICESDLFFYQCLKPGLDGHCIRMSSWLIYARSNNIILSAVKMMLRDYWKSQNRLEDYFLMHHLVSIAMEYFPNEANEIPKVPNDLPHILLLELFQPYDSKKFQHIKQFTVFHKLSYKFEKSDIEKSDTFYEYIMKNLERV